MEASKPVLRLRRMSVWSTRISGQMWIRKQAGALENCPESQSGKKAAHGFAVGQFPDECNANLTQFVF